MASPSFLFLFLLAVMCSGTQTHKCSLEKQVVWCAGSSAYVFNETTGTCHSQDSICPGTPNSFQSLRDCETNCTASTLPDLCYLEPSVGLCKASMKMFYYDAKLETCEKFIYGGCGGNENRFDTLEECKRHCDVSDRISKESENNTIDTKKASNKKVTGVHRTHRTSEPIATAKLGLGQKRNIEQLSCLEPPLKGNCSEVIDQYFFDPMARRCKHFTYSGCGGNSNRFSSMKKCEESCMGHCTDHVEVVDCSASDGIWEFYYDQETGSCLQFEPGKCGGLHSRNIFHNIRQCELSCVEDVCKLMPFGTPCTNQTKWTIYYDPITRTCKKWTDGCLATENSFETVKHCQNKCLPKDLICRLPPNQGRPCPTKDQHFYYDVKNKHCRLYSKGKCPTTSNHFISHRQCSWMCEENACVQEWAPSHFCKTSVPRHYFYNLATRECEISPRGKCSGSNNHFISEQHCENRCVSGDVCTMTAEHGSCHSSEQRWHFHNETGRCRSFSYSGCGGNGNNFLSESICKQACARHPCQSPKNLVRCETPTSKYYYDSKLGLCVFTNTTCFVHGRMFVSFEQCEQACVSDNPCLAAVKEESCRSTHTRFYYDVKSGNCTSFEYSGCHGNANNYQSLGECQAACNEVPPDTSDSVSASEDGTEEALSDSEDLRFIDNESTVLGKKTDQDPKLKNDEMTSDDREESGSVFPPHHGHRCLWPLDVGSCDQVSKRFYFDSKTRTCRQFIYNGCKGNANNFRSLAECNSTCVHICQHPIKIGQCRTKVTRYHYNRTSGMCEPFTGSICSKGLNNFINKDTCESICVSDPCLQSKKVGFCKAAMKRFYYDSKADHCAPFVYGGCSGNENNFLTLDECRDRCRHLSHCRLKPDVNTCSTSSMVGRFYFDNASGTCRQTRRVPCGLYANNFDSLQKCESHCKPMEPCATPGKIETHCNDRFKFERFYFNETKGVCEKHFTCTAGGFETASQCEARCHVNVCTLPSYHGPCDLDQVRYYYSQRSKKCRPFIYGGCYGNKNNFESIEECVSHCDPDRCTQPELAGSCNQHFKRYYSDSATKTCLPFTYSGCGGNSNNFATFESCYSSCHKTPKCRQSPGQVTECNVCELKPENKECEPSSRWRHFYYDSPTGRCLSFNAGVCGAKDGNSFSNLEECEETCELNVCKLPPLPASCSDTSKRGNFFYDRETDNCKSFEMGICGANLNSFLDLQQCENKCVKNVCHLKKDPGPCKGSIQRTYYDRLSGKCEAFHYGGCGGNKNNFETVDNCEKKCIDDPCKLEPDSGRCNAYLPHYYYNPDDGRCHRFIYGGCGGNENRFQTIEDCLQKCQTTHCNLPPDAGPCLAIHRRFYYNSTTGKCALFYYGGCKGNNNNFRTAESCEETCSSDPCKQPAKVGPCEARIKRFYFNSITSQCEQFYYGGCDANENNFETLRECERRCSRDPCTHNPDPGTCKGNRIHFYYDLETGHCRRFTYTGCGGNDNRFISEKQCTEKCIHNRCKKEMDPGSCDRNVARFFYDSKKGECTPFSYGGCDGNSNNFQSEERCRDACLKENPCLLPKISGPCMGLFRRFYYNPVEGTCEEFDYGGCQGNGNNFESLGECQSTCALVRKENVGKCFLPKAKGRCYSQEQRFYYNFELETCEPFTYTGCDGNANNFLSKGQCEQECKFDFCKQPKDAGSCSGNEKRWHFHVGSQLCRSFSYTGCGGNNNNFRSLESCESWCVKPICRQAVAAGNCDQSLPRYYYDWNHGRCYPFSYTGCNGNDNQFLSMEKCQEACNVDPCLQPLSIIGSCQAALNRHFYNRETGRCHDIYFNGCQANGNNFETAEECNRICHHMQEIDKDRLMDNGRF